MASSTCSAAFLLNAVDIAQPNPSTPFSVSLGELLVARHPITGGSLEYAGVFNFIVSLSDERVSTELRGLRGATQGGLVCCGGGTEKLHYDETSGSRAESCAAWMSQPGRPAWVAVVPYLQEYATHHSKFFLLFYGPGATSGPVARLVVISSNLFDDLHDLNQSIFHQSFPVLVPGVSPARSDTGDALLAHLTALKAGRPAAAGRLAEVIKRTRAVDFSTCLGHLIVSVPTYGLPAAAHTGRLGFHGIRRALAEDVPEQQQQRQVTCKAGADSGSGKIIVQFSSLGAVGADYLRNLHSVFATTMPAAAPESIAAVASAVGGAGSKRRRGVNRAAQPDMPPLHLLLDSVSTVMRSIGGEASGGCIPIRWANIVKSHVTALVCVNNPTPSGRSRVASHIKVFLRTAAEDESGTHDSVSAAAAPRYPLPQLSRGVIDLISDEEGGGDYGDLVSSPAAPVCDAATSTRAPPVTWPGATRLLWVMTGSHNLSGSALGYGSSNTGTSSVAGDDVISIKSYEMSVLFTPARYAAAVAEMHARGGECCAARSTVAGTASATGGAGSSGGAHSRSASVTLLHAFERGSCSAVLPDRAALLRSLVPMPLSAVSGQTITVLCPVPFATRTLTPYFRPLVRGGAAAAPVLCDPRIVPWSVDGPRSAPEHETMPVVADFGDAAKTKGYKGTERQIRSEPDQPPTGARLLGTQAVVTDQGVAVSASDATAKRALYAAAAEKRQALAAQDAAGGVVSGDRPL